MLVERIGLTPVKGTRHLTRPDVALTTTGPVGDRVYCLVDPERDRVLRSVENPGLVQAVASLDADGDLAVSLPGGALRGCPEPTGETRKIDYWGRQAAVELVAGPWSEAFSEHLGADVRLARVREAGEVVYAGAVTVLTTGSLAALADRLGRTIDAARFRSTLLVDTGDAPAHVEDGWVGGLLRVGGALLQITARVPRCAVVDTDPVAGARDAPVLAALAGYRRSAGEIVFGVDAEVVVPGRVTTGDPVTVERN